MENIFDSLSEPFPATSISWKPQSISKDKTKALAAAFIDARDVMDRLDSVVGPFNWQTKEEEVCGQHVTYLGIRNSETSEWVWKSDVGFVDGAESEDTDSQTKGIKGTASDGLKRAAVRWGIGRYLYSLPKQWLGWDASSRQFSQQPSLPPWAIPKKKEPGSRVGGSKPGEINKDGIVEPEKRSHALKEEEFQEGSLKYKRVTDTVTGEAQVYVWFGNAWRFRDTVNEMNKVDTGIAESLFGSRIERESHIKEHFSGKSEIKQLTWEELAALVQSAKYNNPDPRWYKQDKSLGVDADLAVAIEEYYGLPSLWQELSQEQRQFVTNMSKQSDYKELGHLLIEKGITPDEHWEIYYNMSNLIAAGNMQLGSDMFWSVVNGATTSGNS